MNNRILIAGTNSGCGKTTVTIAILAALKARGLDIASFKCGPDYIDPMFHRKVIGVNTHNLDPFFCEVDMLRRLFSGQAGKDISIIEGVMGYYDGIGLSGDASTYDVSRALDAPVVLVLNAKGMSNSAGAILQGFLNYRANNNIKGVIFNDLHEKQYPIMKHIAHEAGLNSYGFLPHISEFSIESRHLGLIMAEEIEDIKEKITVLGTFAEMHLNILDLLTLSKSTSKIEVDKFPIRNGEKSVRVAVSCDSAFSFLYMENIEMLEALGCEIAYFSPIKDKCLPENIGGLYLCGGYPELYIRELSNNVDIRKDIKDAIESGLPTIAECGGFLYLHDTLDGAPMVGIIRAGAYKTDKLRRFGYITLKAKKDNLLSPAGESIRAHEFHYYESMDCGDDFVAKKSGRNMTYSCIHATETLYAGFPHLYFPANTSFAKTFVRKAIIYAESY
ncbi:MAG: cobyrinate a,c-diamide synthase [Clostridia bacterium]